MNEMTTGAEEPAPEGSPDSAPKPWGEMNDEEKASFMYAEVVPAMQPRFAAWDARHDEGFGCATCHGEDAEASGFAMPSPSLPPLPPKESAAAEALHREHPEAIAFMKNEVVPTMATLLGMPPYDEATGEGFGCHACHTSTD